MELENSTIPANILSVIQFFFNFHISLGFILAFTHILYTTGHLCKSGYFLIDWLIDWTVKVQYLL